MRLESCWAVDVNLDNDFTKKDSHLLSKYQWISKRCSYHMGTHRRNTWYTQEYERSRSQSHGCIKRDGLQPSSLVYYNLSEFDENQVLPLVQKRG